MAALLFSAASCAPAWAYAQETHAEHDEAIFIQSRAMVKAAAAQAPGLEDREAVAPRAAKGSAQPDFCAAAVPAGDAPPAPTPVVASAAEELPLPVASAPTGARDADVVVVASAAGELARPVDSAPSGEGVAGVTQAKTYFAWFVEVLIILVVVDGFRRWQDSRARAAKVAKAPGIKGGWEQLMQAALEGDEKRCLQLLGGSRGPSAPIVGVDPWGCTMLHAAAKGGSAKVVQQLLERGASVHDRDAWDETPLHMAARGGSTDCCEALLAYGAEVDALNADDRTPLVAAAEGGQESVCQFLLGRGATAGGLDAAELPLLLANLLACRLLAECGPATPAAGYDDGEISASS